MVGDVPSFATRRMWRRNEQLQKGRDDQGSSAGTCVFRGARRTATRLATEHDQRSRWLASQSPRRTRRGRSACSKSLVPRASSPFTDAPAECFADRSERWIEARTRKGLTSAAGDEGKIRKWVAPHLDTLAMADISKDQVEAVRDHLDRAIEKGDTSWKNAANVWAIVRAMFRDACGSKDRTLRIRSDNPCTDVAPPDTGERKAHAYHQSSCSWLSARTFPCPSVD